MLLHVDTDFGGDPDDACALAMLLGDGPTSRSPGSRRTSNGQGGGPDVSSTISTSRTAPTSLSPLARRRRSPPTSSSRRRGAMRATGRTKWHRSRLPTNAALISSRTSIRRGATIVAIGAFTNLALLELAEPGGAARRRHRRHGGLVGRSRTTAFRTGVPSSTSTSSATRRAADVVIDAAHVTFVTLPVAMHAQLRQAHISTAASVRTDRRAARSTVGDLRARRGHARARSEAPTACRRSLSTSTGTRSLPRLRRDGQARRSRT